MTRVLTGVAAVGALSLGLIPQAAAYPVGPWGVEGPCVRLAPNECPWSHSDDGLTWSYKGHSSNYDKLGNYVCGTGDFPGDVVYCNTVMAAVRALPPLPIGEWI